LTIEDGVRCPVPEHAKLIVQKQKKIDVLCYSDEKQIFSMQHISAFDSTVSFVLCIMTGIELAKVFKLLCCYSFSSLFYFSFYWSGC